MENNIWGQIASLAFTGMIVSSLVQYMKSVIEKSVNKVLLTIGLSLIGGGVLYATQFIPASFLTIALGVLASANTVYLLIIKPLAKFTPTDSL